MGNVFSNNGFVPPSILDDTGKTLYTFGGDNEDGPIDNGIQKGNSANLDDEGNKFPKGFTPDIDFYQKPDLTDPETGLPVEQGVMPNVDNTSFDQDDDLSAIKDTFDKFSDTSGKEFRHHLDNFEDGAPRMINVNDTSTIYLSSFVQTDNDNEDPTMYGYDIVIDYPNSPLFNGSVEAFISRFSNYSEINSRLSIITEFKRQFFKFFKSNSNSATNGDGKSGLKAYYLKNLSGLENLVEQSTSDTVKSFVDYGKDKITLTLYEDVTMNMGYLSMLYKSLSWSRINGKQVIPENLLRFDAYIIITEIRKYQRVFKNQLSNGVDVYNDLLSKYTYKLYDCQFFFPKMPHGTNINMWDARTLDEFEIAFDYKYSTLKTEKFGLSDIRSIDNAKVNLSTIKPNETNSATINDNGISPNPQSYRLNLINKYSIQEKTKQQEVSDSDTENGTDELSQSRWDNLKDSLKPSVNVLKNRLKNAVIREANRQITMQARLLNKTLDNIRNSIGLGRMSAPTNVYDSYYIGGMDVTGLANDFRNAGREFVGTSVRSFFEDP